MIWQEVKLCLTATSSVGAEMLTAELVRLGVSGWQVQSAQELRTYLQAEDAPFDYADAGLRATFWCGNAVLRNGKTTGSSIISRLRLGSGWWFVPAGRNISRRPMNCC